MLRSEVSVCVLWLVGVGLGMEKKAVSLQLAKKGISRTSQDEGMHVVHAFNSDFFAS